MKKIIQNLKFLKLVLIFCLINFYPFISFVNGKRKLLNQKLQVKIINFKNQSFTKLINLKNIKPYETKFISLMDSNQKQFLEGQKGTAIIKHNLSGFYLRFLSGNCNDTQKINFLLRILIMIRNKLKNSQLMRIRKIS